MNFFTSAEQRVTGFLAHPRVVVSLIVLLGVYAAYLFVFVAGTSLLPDFMVYLRAGEAMNKGRNIYTEIYRVEYIQGTFFKLSYLYPPLLAHLLSKTVALGEPTIKMLWSVVSFVALAVSVFQLSGMLEYSWWGKVSRGVRVLVISFLFLCFEPLPSGAGHGQVTAVLFCLLTTFMYESVRRREITAGLALALAIHIKMTPVLLLLAPLAFRRWRTVGWCIGGIGTFALITIVDAQSFTPFLDFIGSLASTPNHPGLRGNEFNFSMERVLLIPLGLFDHRLSRQGLTLAMLILTVVVVKLLPKRDERDYLVTSGFLIVWMVGASPIIWFHHFAWLLVPILMVTMAPATTTDLRLKNLTIAMGIFFSFSKVLLIHANVTNCAPALTGISALIPLVLVVWLCYALCAPYVALSKREVPIYRGGLFPCLISSRPCHRLLAVAREPVGPYKQPSRYHRRPRLDS